MSAEQIFWGNCGHAPDYRCMHCAVGAVILPNDYVLRKRIEDLEERIAKMERGA